MTGSGLLCLSDVEGFADGFGNCFRLLYPRIPLGYRMKNVDHINILVVLLMRVCKSRLASNRDQWSAVHVSICDPCGEVGCPWAQGRDAHSCPASQPAIHTSHKRGPLLMPDRDKFDRFR